jgi:hypothetical protein
MCVVMFDRSDFGFDPLGLMDPVNAGGFVTPQWLAYSEVIAPGARSLQEQQQHATQHSKMAGNSNSIGSGPQVTGICCRVGSGLVGLRHT